jgi:uncharacterized protein YhaN
MDVTDTTPLACGLVTRARMKIRRRFVPPDRRAQVVLLLSAFVLGGVVSAIVFATVWRTTAVQSQRARAATLRVSHRLDATTNVLARTQTQLTGARASLAKLSAQHALLQRRLAALRRANARTKHELAPLLQSLATNAANAEQQTQKLGSALATLHDYLQNAAATGIDPAFLAAQVAYLIRSSESTASTLGTLSAEAQRAQRTSASR